jgi:hypothetical protein
MGSINTSNKKLIKNLLSSGIFLFISFMGFSQSDLSESKAFSLAVENGTRTNEGIPGEKYWQNKATYTIDVEIIPEEKKLLGTELINYKNNSPDTLKYLVFHVFQNLYKKGSQRDSPVHQDDVTAGVTIVDLKIQNKLITDFQTSGTLLFVKLKEPLLPSNLINIEISWNFSIPAKSDIRMGGKDESSFFIGQWYPKIAVYDDLKGWDINIHTCEQEFYCDLNDFKYTVKTPDGYIVWGSGLLQNAKQNLSKTIYAKYLQAQKSDSVISIVSSDDYNSGKAITLGNIWEFEAINVPDVAFGLSDHFLWDGTSLSSDSNNSIFIDAAYPSEAKDFTEVALLAKKSIHYFSTELPGYPFPFPEMTVFNGTNGTSGMEYPMIANDPSADNRGRTVDVTAHEIAHMYFPFYVLTNETEHAWMDEAFASMIPYKYQLENDTSLNRLTRSAKAMSDYANSSLNVSTETPSTQLKGSTSYFNLYQKPAVGLYVLQDMLGEKLFKECLYTYIDLWKGKHPTSNDFFHLINEVSHKNLNWFWKAWFIENGYPDLSIDYFKENKTTYEVSIKKIGSLPVPIALTVIFNDQSREIYHYTAAEWQNNDSKLVTIKKDRKIEKLELGNKYIPDTNSSNNFLVIK